MRSSRSRPSRRAALLAGALALGLGLTTLATPAEASKGWSYQHSSGVTVKLDDWMSWIPDDSKIVDMSLPGTHDTMTYDFTKNAWTPTQKMTLTQQLNAGIRAVDMRVANVDYGSERWDLYHGSNALGFTFGQVMQKIEPWLEDHPRETILMRLGADGVPLPKGSGGKNKTEEARDLEYNTIFERYAANYPDVFWDDPDHFDQDSLQQLSLDDVRGKVVVIQAWSPRTGTRHGYDWDDSALVKKPRTVTVDSMKTIAGEDNDAPEKMDAISRFLHRGDETGVLLALRWTGTNGSGSITPADAAGGLINPINQAVVELLIRKGYGRVGVIESDFPGAGLIGAVVAANLDLTDDVPAAQADFPRWLEAVAQSLEGNAKPRRTALHSFVTAMRTQDNWATVVCKVGGKHTSSFRWDLSDEHLTAQIGAVDDFRSLAVSSPTGLTRYSTTRMQSTLDQATIRTSDSAAAIASSVLGRFKAKRPDAEWLVVVKRGPGGAQNWSYRAQRASVALRTKRDIKVVVIGWARS